MQNNSSTSLFDSALSYQRDGDIEEAEKQYLALLADLPAALNNLGVIKRQKGQLEEAIRVQRLAIQIAPKNLGYHKNLIRTLKGLKRHSEVENALAEAIKFHPDEKSFLWQLAKLRAKHKDPKAIRDAIEIYKKYLVLAPDDKICAVSLANCLIRLDQKDDAIKLLQPYRTDSEINYKIQVLCDDQIDRAPAEYVRAHFDRTARGFERQLIAGLDYRAPELLLNLVTAEIDPAPVFGSVLDLGCGTGLCGVKFHPFCGEITGVDLSSKMLGIAARKNIYSRLKHDEIASFLNSTEVTYDLIMSSDALIYFKDLSPIFSSIAQRLAPNGYFLFSTEHSKENDYRVLPSGRFSHSEAYVNRLASEYGLAIKASKQATIRKEYGKKVKGGLYLMSRE